jgi:hypothetical protein
VNRNQQVTFIDNELITVSHHLARVCWPAKRNAPFGP